MVNTFQHAKHILEESLKTNTPEKLLKSVSDALAFLEKSNINKEILEETRLGKTVNEFRKSVKNEGLSKRAKELVKSWRKFLVPESVKSSVKLPLRPTSSPLVLSASSSPCLTNGTTHKALSVNNNSSKARPQQTFKPVSPAQVAPITPHRTVQPKPSITAVSSHSPLNGRPNGHHPLQTDFSSSAEGSAFHNVSKSHISPSTKEATTYSGHGPNNLKKRKPTDVLENSRRPKRPKLATRSHVPYAVTVPPAPPVMPSHRPLGNAISPGVQRAGAGTKSVMTKPNKVKTTKEILESLYSENTMSPKYKKTPLLSTTNGAIVTPPTSATVTPERIVPSSPPKPKVQTVDDEVKAILAQLPPLEDSQQVNWEDSPLPELTYITPAMLETEQLESINGYSDYTGQWRRPEEMLVRRDDTSEGLHHILPYVNIDW